MLKKNIGQFPSSDIDNQCMYTCIFGIQKGKKKKKKRGKKKNVSLYIYYGIFSSSFENL